MPGMNGYETTQRVLQMFEGKRITPPVVVGLTGDNSEETKIMGRKAGMARVLCKPLGKQELSRCIVEMVP